MDPIQRQAMMDQIAHRNDVANEAEPEQLAELGHMNEALQRFRAARPEIVEDDDLMQKIVAEDARMVQDGDRRDYVSRWNAIADSATGADLRYTTLAMDLATKPLDEAAQIVRFMRTGSFMVPDPEPVSDPEIHSTIAGMAASRAGARVTRALVRRAEEDSSE